MESSTQKEKTMSIMKGIAIISVVVGHVFVGTSVETFVNQYHLAVFYFVAGYFFKDKYLSNIRGFYWRRFKTIYLPFMEFGLFFILIHNIMYMLHIVGGHYSIQNALWELRNITVGMTIGQEPMMGAMWFCPALFTISVLSSTTLKAVNHFNGIIWIQFLLILLLPILGGLLIRFGIHSPRCIWQYMQCCGIFYAGYFFNKWKHLLKISRTLQFVMIVGIVTMVYILNCHGYYAFLQNSQILKEKTMAIIFIGSVSSIAVYYISHAISNINYMGATIAYVGDSSFSIMALHFLCFKIVSFTYCILNNESFNRMVEYPVIKNVSLIWSMSFVLVGILVPLAMNHLYKCINNFIRTHAIR